MIHDTTSFDNSSIGTSFLGDPMNAAQPPAESSEPVVPPEPAPVVYIVDDDPAIRDSLGYLLESVQLQVSTFASPLEFLTVPTNERPGCIVLDVRMAEMNGLELLEKLRAQGCLLPMIVTTAYADIPTTVRAFRGGAIDFFEKTQPRQLLIDRIRKAVAESVQYFGSMRAYHKLMQRFATLTSREQQVLSLVATGDSSRKIGDDLSVSFKTIEAHRAKIMKKLDVQGVPQLVRAYWEYQRGPMINPEMA